VLPQRAPTGTIVVVRVLLVEDDRAIAASVVEGLAADGHDVVHVGSGVAALDLATDRVDMVLLDLGLPDMDGRDVCTAIRQRSDVPIIMLTARGDEIDRVVGLELGADDYVTKPFSMREVLARIRAVARRAGATGSANGSGGPDADTPLQSIGSLTIDRRTRRVVVDTTAIELTAKEFDVLSFLAECPGTVVTRTEILEQVWDRNWFGPTKTVDAHVAALRKKLGDHRWIEAVRGVGFRLEPPDGDETPDPPT
jgi:two-component system, OmpR family, response regulator RegX3